MKEYRIEFIVKTNAPMKVMENMKEVMEVQLEFLEERDNCVCGEKTYKYTLVKTELVKRK